MSAEKTNGKKANILMFDEAGQFPSAQKMFDSLIGKELPNKFNWGIDSYKEEKYARRKLNAGN